MNDFNYISEITNNSNLPEVTMKEVEMVFDNMYNLMDCVSDNSEAIIQNMCLNLSLLKLSENYQKKLDEIIDNLIKSDRMKIEIMDDIRKEKEAIETLQVGDNNSVLMTYFFIKTIAFFTEMDMSDLAVMMFDLLREKLPKLSKPVIGFIKQTKFGVRVGIYLKNHVDLYISLINKDEKEFYSNGLLFQGNTIEIDRR